MRSYLVQIPVGTAALLLLALLFLAPLAAQPGPAPLRALILTGNSDLPYHDWRVTTPFLDKLLTDSGRFHAKTVDKVQELSSQTLAQSDVLILNYNGPRWGAPIEHEIESAVRSGKGLVAVHGVSYGAFFGMEQKEGRWVDTSDPGWTGYAEMLGATWKAQNIGHARRHVYSVKWTQPDHPIARGLETSFLANDELYHRMDLKPRTVVLATAYSDPAAGGTGRDEPQIWTLTFGQGRVVHITLGHDVTAMQQPGFRAAFTRASEWVATGEVTISR